MWTFSESQGGENPNKPGTYYTNRRLEKVEVGGTLDPALAGSSSPAAAGGGYGAPRSAEDRISIERQTIIKAVVAASPPSWIKTVDEWFTFIDQLDDWMGRARHGAAPASPEVRAATTEPSAADPPASDQPPPDDSDIPF